MLPGACRWRRGAARQCPGCRCPSACCCCSCWSLRGESCGLWSCRWLSAEMIGMDVRDGAPGPRPVPACRDTPCGSPRCPTTQVSFEPPPCELLTTSCPSGSATRVSPPGSTQTSVAVVDRERAQVGVPGPHPVLDQRRDRRELHDRLRDPAARVGAQPRGQLVELRLRGVRPDDEPLAARAVDRLHDEFVEPVEHLFERAGLLEPPGVDVGQDRLLRQVVPDEVGQVGVDELVVGDPVADRVGDRDVAEPGGEHEAGRPEHRVGAELQRIEELVVDPAVDHVDAGRAGGGAHEHPAAGAVEVASLDELDAHQAREQGVLEVRRVVDARGEHDDRRIVDAVGGGRAQRLQQPLRVVADRAHAHRHEQLGKGLRHDPAVRDDVADARRHAHVVFEHPPGALLVADEVDARDVDADAVRGDDPGGLAVEMTGRTDEPGRDHAVDDRALLAVHVGEEPLQRADALLDARLDA